MAASFGVLRPLPPARARLRCVRARPCSLSRQPSDAASPAPPTRSEPRFARALLWTRARACARPHDASHAGSPRRPGGTITPGWAATGYRAHSSALYPGDDQPGVLAHRGRTRHAPGSLLFILAARSASSRTTSKGGSGDASARHACSRSSTLPPSQVSSWRKWRLASRRHSWHRRRAAAMAGGGGRRRQHASVATRRVAARRRQCATWQRAAPRGSACLRRAL